jgi:hypothetical protein
LSTPYRGWDAPAVDPDDLVLGVDPGPEPADDLAVHLDPALADQFLAVAAAADARRGQHLLQPDPAGDVGQAVALPGLVAPVIVVAEFVGQRRHFPLGRGQLALLHRRPGVPAPARGRAGTAVTRAHG